MTREQINQAIDRLPDGPEPYRHSVRLAHDSAYEDPFSGGLSTDRGTQPQEEAA